MCCRLRLDTSELRKRGGGLFGSNPLTGSIGVVTLNLPQLAYLSTSSKEFLASLEVLCQQAADSLAIKRKLLESETDRGLYPYAARFLRHVKARTGKWWTQHFGTIGIIGMNEALLNLGIGDLTTSEGQAFAVQVMDSLRSILARIQEEEGQALNLEASPAEGTAYRLAQLDKRRFPKIITAGEEVPYYTNSSQLPVTYTSSIHETLELQDDLQSRYTGGTVLHLYLGESPRDVGGLKTLIKGVFTQYKLPYLSITPTFSICPDHGYLKGEVVCCPICQQTTEVWTRVVGYLRPVQHFNQGKQEERRQRINYAIESSALT
jgi:ribonucleoside-triphosphate reductase (formate)